MYVAWVPIPREAHIRPASVGPAVSGGRSVRCTTCDRAIDEDARVCPHCGELQPTPILAAGLCGLGVAAMLFGFPLGVFTVGPSRWIGFTLAVVGLGLAFGGYTSYLDAKARRRGRRRER